MKDAVCRMIVDEGLVPAGATVLVGLSGGADSVALLHLLLECVPSGGFSVRAAHLDHGMRAGSAADAAFVRDLCAACSVPLSAARVDIPGRAAAARRGLEEAARDARRAFLRETAARHGCAVIALGHHRGDQAETFLHRLLRGSGLSGLAAMRPSSPPFIRPLLPFGRDQIRAYLAARGLAFVEDPSNRDPAYTRNRIRHRLLPLLRSFNPRIEEHLARLCRRIAAEEDYWRLEVERALAAVARRDAGGLRLERPGLAALHPALRSRVLRGALERVRGDLAGIAAGHIEGVEALLFGERSQGEIHLPGAWVARRYERLWFRAEPPPAGVPFDLPVPGPGRYLLPDGRGLEVSLADLPQGETSCAVEFAAGAVPFPLRVRSARPGDRFRPSGAGGGKKLKDFFIDAKMPLEERRRVPLVTGDEILWVAGVRRCEGRPPAPGGGGVLRLVLSAVDSETNRL